MKNVITFNGSPRLSGNTTALLSSFIGGVRDAGGTAEEFRAQELNLEYCRGCLRCNILGRCSIENDDWSRISEKILMADVIVFATPVYFHHVTAPLKKLIDRFRSFVHVQITETGLKHTPRHSWKKDFALILCMGSSDDSDARPVEELFRYIAAILGPENRVHIIKATRLAAAGQVLKSRDDLAKVYARMEIPVYLAEQDYRKNQQTLKNCYDLGNNLIPGTPQA